MSNREEDLYHESARELARMVVDLETTVEGLGQENTELSQQLERAEIQAAALAWKSEQLDELRIKAQEDHDSRLEGFEARDKKIRELEQLVGSMDKEIEGHKTRYSAALKMIERRSHWLADQKTAYRRLAVIHSNMVTAVSKANESVAALRDVPTSELDHAIGLVCNAIDTALLA
jgi:predicted RNase H-like nuclease (RuvC/YqgF family)